MDIIKTILIGIFSTVALGTSNAHAPSAADLLDKYAQNQDKLNSSVIAKFECEEKFVKGNEVSIDRVVPAEVRLDGQKYFACTNHYYDMVSDTTLPLDETDYRQFTLWDDERRIKYYDYGEVEEVSRASISRQDKPGAIFASEWPGSPLFGIRYYKAERIDTVLRQCETLSVRDEMEIIDSEACYVIDAKSPSSSYTVWMNPNRGYSISQAVIKLGPGTQGAFGVLSENEDRSLTVSDVRFQQIGEVHVPMAYNAYFERRRDGVVYRKVTIRGKVTDITFDPDHEKLASFVPKMREGTTIRDKDTGSSFIWHEGMKFIFDQWDGRFKYVPKDWSILVGVDKPLPSFEGIELSLPVEQTKGKAMLLCFFDMLQRSSRNCLRQLSEKAWKLKARDVFILAVQTSEVEQSKFNEWLKENNLPFPVERITADFEKVRFTWGVRSLPWLILTDKDHVATAEGFTLAELDEKIGSSSGD